MTDYISNIRFSNNDMKIDVRFDFWRSNICRSHVVTVSVDTGKVVTKNFTKDDVIAFRAAQKNSFVQKAVTQLRKDICARLRRKEKNHAS
jgi:hypothetical protein